MFTPGLKLALGASVVVGVTAYMMYVGASSSWKYYMTADECLAQGEQLVGARLRVSGRIEPGSLQVSPDRGHASFRLAGQSGQLAVVCEALLPDNLQEGMDVVVEGQCETGGAIRGDKVLTRCASKYDSAGGTNGELREASLSKGRR